MLTSLGVLGGLLVIGKAEITACSPCSGQHCPPVLSPGATLEVQVNTAISFQQPHVMLSMSLNSLEASNLKEASLFLGQPSKLDSFHLSAHGPCLQQHPRQCDKTLRASKMERLQLTAPVCGHLHFTRKSNLSEPGDSVTQGP